MSNRIGSLLFCQRCGSLLNPPADDDSINCEECGLVEHAAAYENLNIETRSHPNAFPSSLHLKKSLVVNTIADGAKAAGAEIDEKCPSCGNDKATFQTLQLRSADEGSTVFYTCTKCEYKWSQNN